MRNTCLSRGTTIVSSYTERTTSLNELHSLQERYHFHAVTCEPAKKRTLQHAWPNIAIQCIKARVYEIPSRLIGKGRDTIPKRNELLLTGPFVTTVRPKIKMVQETAKVYERKEQTRVGASDKYSWWCSLGSANRSVQFQPRSMKARQ